MSTESGARCDFCGGSAVEVGRPARLDRVRICSECASAFTHQLGHGEGTCTNCGRGMPEAERLHGEGDVRICEVCLHQEPAPEDEDVAVPLTHLTDEGAVHMVDVADKEVTDRTAVAEAVVSMSPEVADRLFSGDLPKGDALATVRLAGIMAAKRTPELIPLAHPIGITSVTVTVERHPGGVRIEAVCGTRDRTGIEMEAMTAVSVSALALYDMVKSVERGVTVREVRLLSKTGGRSGAWRSSPGSAPGAVVPDETAE